MTSNDAGRSVHVVVMFCMLLPQCMIVTLAGQVSGNLTTPHRFHTSRTTHVGGVVLEQPLSAKDVAFTLPCV